MKRTLIWVVCVIMALSVFETAAYAIDDAAGLNYRISLRICDAAGSPAVSFEKDDVFKVDVILENMGENKAPYYTVQGKLSYTGNCIVPEKLDCSGYVASNVEKNMISFNIFDKTLNGVDLANPYTLMTITFRAATGGTSDIGFDTFDVTNSDASLRQVDYSQQETVIISGGMRENSKNELMSIMELCKEELEKTIISEDSTSVLASYYCISQSKHDRLQSALEDADLVYNNDTVGTDDLAAAIDTLDNELGLFKANKQKGALRGYSIKPSTITSKLTVTATAEEHGKIDSKYATQSVAQNTSVTVIAVPDAGYTVDKVSVNGEAFEGSETFTIEKVTNDTVVKFTFKWKNVFEDVLAEDWFYDSVMYAHENGLMNGMADTQFAPQVNVTRGMFVTVLHRMEKQPEASSVQFADVASGAYYEKAVAWCAEKGIVNGISATSFAPEAKITREQMATIIYRYLTLIQNEADNNTTGESFADNDKISQFAKEAVAFCSEKGIMNGREDGIFAPTDNATRAETAAVLQRIIK